MNKREITWAISILAAAILFGFMIGTVRGLPAEALAEAGEVTYCRDDPGPGRWIYRVIDGQRCWFEAGRLRRGREKPREELAWPKYGSPAPMEIIEPMRPPSLELRRASPPWEYEERFKGETR